MPATRHSAFTMSDIAICVENLSKPHHIGSGQATSILELAALLCRSTASRLAPQISAAARVGDIRHCTADNAAAGSTFGYEPAVDLAAGLARLIADGAGDHPAADLMAARRDLAQAGLLR
jgi:dTDP-L-rhamnose 4-epimerase